MEFFVWIMTSKGPLPQVWSEDYTLNPNSRKLNTELRVLRKEHLRPDQQGMPLDELAQIYPCPVVNDTEPRHE